MLFKSADDKSKRLRLLESLQASPHIDARQRNWLAEELTRQHILAPCILSAPPALRASVLLSSVLAARAKSALPFNTAP